MDTTMLQTPRTDGRSRFSKALPMPLPSPDVSEAITSPVHQIPLTPPGQSTMANTTAFPPKKSSVGAQFVPKPIYSPLPALPAKPTEPELQKKMPPIPKKAVASLLPTPDAVDVVKLKRNSSISSLFSAYSNTSSDSVHKSSRGSSHTKGSDASLSPQRDRPSNGRQESSTRQYKAYSRNLYKELSAQEKAMMMHELLSLPPPMKDASRPITSRVGLPATPHSGDSVVAPFPALKDMDDTSSQVTLMNATPPQREIWRRRASSKSDRSIAVSGFKLAITHGLTAEPTGPVPAPTAAPTQTSSSNPTSLRPSETVNKPSPLLPTSSSALVGRDVRSQPHNETHNPIATPQPPTKDSPTLKLDVVLQSPTPRTRAGGASSEPAEYKDQEPVLLTSQEEKTLSDAIGKVINRDSDWTQISPNSASVWPCKELTGDHISCISDHRRWLHSENFHNSIACMLCLVGTREHRRVCKTCAIRVCVPCSELMTGRKIEDLNFDALASRSKAKSRDVATIPE